MCPSHVYAVAAMAVSYYYREKILCMVWLHYFTVNTHGLWLMQEMGDETSGRRKNFDAQDNVTRQRHGA